MFQDVVATADMVNQEAIALQRPEQTARRNRGQFGHASTATVMRRIGDNSGTSYRRRFTVDGQRFQVGTQAVLRHGGGLVECFP